MSEETITQTVNHVDYKDINRIKNHLNPHSRMHSRKRTHMSAKAQRQFAQATKRARFMALVPYVSH